jgi:hypothetical protein
MISLPKPKVVVLKAGTIAEHVSGDDHIFYLEGANRASITAYLSSKDATYSYYRGTLIDAGDRPGEREWLEAWVAAGTAEPYIRVNHTERTIEIIKYKWPTV